jgi:hypothetical protein
MRTLRSVRLSSQPADNSSESFTLTLFKLSSSKQPTKRKPSLVELRGQRSSTHWETASIACVLRDDKNRKKGIIKCGTPQTTPNTQQLLDLQFQRYGG